MEVARDNRDSPDESRQSRRVTVRVSLTVTVTVVPPPAVEAARQIQRS